MQRRQKVYSNKQLIDMVHSGKGHVMADNGPRKEQANPADIVEAKLDGICPECGKPGTFTDAGGWCTRCSWSY